MESESGANRRLDMAHGFIKHIMRNQIERDEYDRCHKTYTNEVKRKMTPKTDSTRRQRLRPERQVYRPPGARQQSNTDDDALCDAATSSGVDHQTQYRLRVRARMNKELVEKQQAVDQLDMSASSSSANNPVVGKPLFRLEFEDLDGVVHALIIHEGDSSARVAKLYCQKLGLPSDTAQHIRAHVEARMQQLRQEQHTTETSNVDDNGLGS